MDPQPKTLNPKTQSHEMTPNTLGVYDQEVHGPLAIRASGGRRLSHGDLGYKLGACLRGSGFRI